MIPGPSLMRWVGGYEGRYLVHRDGYVVNRLANALAIRIDRYGYANVRLSLSGKKSWKKLHRLVCEAWHGPAPSAAHHAAHLDNDPLNNRPENLAWLTPKENNAHKAIFGTHQDHSGEKHPQAKLSNAQAKEIARRVAAGEPGRALGREYGISQSQVSRIATGKRRQASPKGSGQ